MPCPHAKPHIICVTQGCAPYIRSLLNNSSDRLQKPAATTWYAFSPNGKLLYEDNGTTVRTHTYAGSRHLAVDETEAGTTTRYYTHTDHLGSVTTVTDSEGTLVWDNEYLPFGEEQTPDESRFAMFTGKQKDPDTGLYYFNARWYDASLGRFVTQDPIRDGVNWYAYCENNPLKFVDPTGLELVLAEGTGRKERELYNQAVDYLRSSESGEKLFDKIEQSSTVFKVEVKAGRSSYYPKDKTVTWNPYSGLDIDGELQSSAIGLAHELGHARQDDLGLIPEYEEEKLEQQVVDYIEKPITRELNEPTREKYSDVGLNDQVIVSDPTKHTHKTYEEEDEILIDKTEDSEERRGNQDEEDLE